MITSVLLSGVGGQGILLAEKIIATAAELAGNEVCANEIHGMAQRGGSVVAQIRFGSGVYSPLILEGSADAVLALEMAEAVRCAHYLKPGGFAAVAKQKVIPVTVTTGAAHYPEDVEERLNRVYPRMKLADCVPMALEMGDVRLANTIMVGVLSNEFDALIPVKVWHDAIAKSVKPQFLENNIKAFELGRSL